MTPFRQASKTATELIDGLLDRSPDLLLADYFEIPGRSPAFDDALQIMLTWAADQQLSIAQRSAACRDIGAAIRRRAPNRTGVEMLHRTRCALLRAGVDN